MASTKSPPALFRDVHTAARTNETIVRTSPATGKALLPLNSRDRMWFGIALPFNSYRAYSFALHDCPDDVERRLKDGLRTCLDSSAAFQFLSGRYDRKSKAVVDSNHGIPFSSLQLEHPLPEESNLDEELVWRLADLRRPRRAETGGEPLVTATLAIFSGGAAVLTVSAAHAVLDGEALIRFVGEWASCARGAPPGGGEPPAARADRATTSVPPMRVPALERLLIPKFMNFLTGRLFTALKKLPRSATCGALGRPCVTFSAETLAQIKDAASPPPPAWISTQEALAALLLLALWRLTKTQKKPHSRAMFWLAGRRFYGGEHGAPADPAANYLVIIPVDVKRETLEQGVRAVATRLHDGLAEFGPKDAAEQHALYDAADGCVSAGIKMMKDKFKPPADCACEMKLNNLSKLSLQSFGADGAAASSAFAWTMAGPTAVLADGKGGVRIFLQKGDDLPKGVTASQLKSELEASWPLNLGSACQDGIELTRLV